MHAAGEVFWSLQSALDKRLVDDDLGGDVRQFASLPCFDLLSHRLEVSLHPAHTDRKAVNERERLRVFREDGRKHAWDNVTKVVRRVYFGPTLPSDFLGGRNLGSSVRNSR
jgi:hypothetical protein